MNHVQRTLDDAFLGKFCAVFFDSKYQAYYGKVFPLQGNDSDSGCKNVELNFLHDYLTTTTNGFRLFLCSSNPDTSVVDEKCIFMVQLKRYLNGQQLNSAPENSAERRSSFRTIRKFQKLIMNSKEFEFSVLNYVALKSVYSLFTFSFASFDNIFKFNAAFFHCRPVAKIGNTI